MQRHEILRTTFRAANGQPVQVISPTLAVALPAVDLEGLDAEARDASVQRLATEEARRPFDLSQGPLVRVTLLRLSAQRHILLLAMHHIIADGWSLGIFLRELAALYDAFSSDKPSPLPDLPLQYADFES